MSTIEALILGIIQGITEFLPISSSGHLNLGQYALGLENLHQYIIFDLICHVGTLCAIFAVYSSQIKSLFLKDRLRLGQIIIGTLPLFPILFVLKPIESVFGKMEYLGPFFMVTALLLYAGIKWSKEKSEDHLRKSWWQHAFIIGIFQAFAILPGISRSGATISGALLLGWKRLDAVAFSFLLVVPAILGGTALKLFQLFMIEKPAYYILGISQYIAGFSTSFLVGYAALLLLIRLAAKEKLMYFVWYCLLLGIGTLCYFSINP